MAGDATKVSRLTRMAKFDESSVSGKLAKGQRTKLWSLCADLDALTNTPVDELMSSLVV